jgi:hypothetical protein
VAGLIGMVSLEFATNPVATLTNYTLQNATILDKMKEVGNVAQGTSFPDFRYLRLGWLNAESR